MNVGNKTQRFFVKKTDILELKKKEKKAKGNSWINERQAEEIRAHGINGFGGSDAFHESLALKIILDSGIVRKNIDVVNLIFSYVSAESQRSIGVFEHKGNLKTIDELYSESKISEQKFKRFELYLSQIQKLVNEYLSKNYQKYGLTENSEIIDIGTNNAFYDEKMLWYYYHDQCFGKFRKYRYDVGGGKNRSGKNVGLCA